MKVSAIHNFSEMRVAFLVQLPKGVSPGQRFRCENWFPYLQQQHIALDYFPFFDEKAYRILYHPGNGVQKMMGTLRGIWGRFRFLFWAHRYQFIFVQREAAPIGPPLFEWVLAKLLRKKIIFDFDDAIWIPQQSNPLVAALKCYWKVKHIIRWSYKVAAGNQYLANYALSFNPHTVVIPTVVDTELQHNKQKIHVAKKEVVVGWTGSHSTLKYLEQLLPVLEKVLHQLPFQLLVIADRPPAASFSNLHFIKWKAATEIDDLLQMDIGIMPLDDDAWSEGKCGFKIIQYMALGIPAVAAAVGVNKEIIQHGQNGYVVASHSQGQWEALLISLLSDVSLRANMGNAAVKRIANHYSIRAVQSNFIQLFEQ